MDPHTKGEEVLTTTVEVSQAAAVIALSWETDTPETSASRATEWWKTGGHGW